MPLPDLLPENTARFKVFYTVGGQQHTQTIRTDPISPSAMNTLLQGYYTEIGPSIYATSIDDVQFAVSGSNIFNSVSMPIVGSTFGAGAPLVPGERAYYYSFVGRSPAGYRARFYQFGAKALGGDYRFPVGEDANLDDARGVIEGASGAWLAIDGLKPIWKSYSNAGVNSYWQRQIRP